MKKIVAIDIGNTDIVCGIFQGKKFLREWRLNTKVCTSTAKCRKWLSKILGGKKEIQGIILCSVVPKKNRFFKKAASLLHLPIDVVGETVRCPIPNRYWNPKEVGQDRLVNAYAALKRYGAPAIIVDFGTAITVDLVSRRGEYLGGIIAPGMGISLEALNEKTALLPSVRLKSPFSLLGRNTEGSMLSGAFYGFASLCDGLIAKLRKKYGKKIQSIVTGGHSNIILTYCKQIDYINTHLTLQGLQLISKEIHPE